jgi:hypothetical protein
MLPLRHKEEYFVKYQNIPLAKPTDGLKYGKRQLDDIWRLGVLVKSVWTWQLQDPLHREEHKTCFALSMDKGKWNIQVLPIRVLEWVDHMPWAMQLEQYIANNIHIWN